MGQRNLVCFGTYRKIILAASDSLQEADNPKVQTAGSSSKVQILPCENESEDLEAVGCISVDSTSVAPSVSTQVGSLDQKPEEVQKACKMFCYRPTGEKKPAVQKCSHAWQECPSFGFVKCAKATNKSHIQFRKTMGEKFSLLVNVQGDGVDHHQTVDSLMDFVCQECGLDTAKVLAKRDDMLKSGN